MFPIMIYLLLLVTDSDFREEKKQQPVFRKKCVITLCTKISFIFSSNSEKKTKVEKDHREPFLVH